MTRQSPASLSGLPEKKLRAGRNKLQRFGITPERWLAMLGASDDAMNTLVAGWPQAPSVSVTASYSEFVYNAKRVGELLGISVENLPSPKPTIKGGRIIFLPPRITGPTELRRTQAPICKDQNWYDHKGYTAKPGYWEVLLPFPNSNRRTDQGQDKHIAVFAPEGFHRTPMLVDSLLLAVHKKATGEDLLKHGWVRCPDESSPGRHVGLNFVIGELSIRNMNWDYVSEDHIWSSIARWISS